MNENVIEETVKALEKFGRHESWCLFAQAVEPPRSRCDCGFSSALASLRKAAEGAHRMWRCRAGNSEYDDIYYPENDECSCEDDERKRHGCGPIIVLPAPEPGKEPR